MLIPTNLKKGSKERKKYIDENSREFKTSNIRAAANKHPGLRPVKEAKSVSTSKQADAPETSSR